MRRVRPQSAPLYRRLPHGPSGIPRDEVARNQRTRIFGGMVEAVARRGYRATTVADVIALAGVSRRAFYELFPNKEACFLATYDIVVARARKQMIDAWRAERGFSARLHASCAAFFEHLADEPGGARLVLLEAPAVGAPSRTRTDLASTAFERLIAGAFQSAPNAARLPPLAVRAVAGGARHLVAERLRAGREGEVRGLGGPLLDWMLGYATPLAPRLGAVGPPRRIHAGSAPAPSFLLAADPRARSLEALVLLTLDRGYLGLADEEIARRAGISLDAFHREFATREACYLALLDGFATDAAATARAAGAGAPSWPALVRSALGAFLDYLLDHTELVAMAFVEVLDAGAAAAARSDRALDGLLDVLLRDAPPPRHGAEVIRTALAGGLHAIVASCATGARLEHLVCLVDQLAFVVLAPHLGPRSAVAALAAARSAQPAR